MALDRTRRSPPQETVTLTDLIARRDYGRAIEQLRAQIQRGPLDSRTQLQLADALVLAGRAVEALPIFIALSDTFAAEGYFAKAIAVLKRVDKIEPGRADTRERLEKCIQKQRGAPTVVVPPPPPRPRTSMPEIGMEEMGITTLTRLRALKTGDGELVLEELPPRTEPPVLREMMERVVAEAGRPEAPPDVAAEPPMFTAEDAAVPLEIELSTTEFRELVLDIVQEAAQPAPLLDTQTVAIPAAAPETSSPGVALEPVPKGTIESAALFAALSPDEVLALVNELGLVRCEAGDIIVTEGEPGDSLFVIGQGRLKVFGLTPKGRSYVVGELREGDFFGEVGALSGRPRSATVIAASDCDLLVLDRPRMEALVRVRPHVREVLEDFYVKRAENPLLAVRVLPTDDHPAQARAAEILESYFGASDWDPRMQLRLAHVLARSGKNEDAVSILFALAEETARAGFPAKAIALLKKAEGLRIAPLRELDEPEPAPAPWGEWKLRPEADDMRDSMAPWLRDVIREAARRSGPAGVSSPAAPEGFRDGLRASPLFEGLADAERLAFVEGLRLRGAEPGDVLLTQGEPGESIFVLASGSVKVFVRNPAGRNERLCVLPEGAFFGEIAALSGCERTATVVAAERCEILELTRQALDTMSNTYPRVREVLERFYTERTMKIEES
jgi:CRP-like cAMP-binding protein